MKEIKYKNYSMDIETAFHFGMSFKSCCVYKDGKLITHFSASRHYSDEQALKKLQDMYKHDLEQKVLKILKKSLRTRLNGLINEKLLSDDESEILKEWLDNE